MSMPMSGQLSKWELLQLRRLKAVKEALDEFKRKGIDADIPICPLCKSPRLVHMTSFIDLGYIGSFHPAYYCVDCGWFGRSLMVMSNRPEEDVVLEDLESAYPELKEDSAPSENFTK